MKPEKKKKALSEEEQTGPWPRRINGRMYDHRSARHNGLVGPGADLREMIKSVNAKGEKS